MKSSPDNENEWICVGTHVDPAQNRLTPVARFAPDVAQAVVTTIARIVQTAHRLERDAPTPAGEMMRAQEFEEGDVYMLEAPFDGYFADRYLMDFYDVRERGICSRMHIHTGLRFVRMMTGNNTCIRVSSLSPMQVAPSVGWAGAELENFTDVVSSDGQPVRRYNVVVPPDCWVDMQIPRGVSHQFNADGTNAVIDSVHPEESIETLREHMSGYKMMAQTLFLSEHKNHSDSCNLTVGHGH